MNSIKKNYIYNVIYQILIIILPLITAPYVARILGATGTGIYSYTHSIAQYFVLLIMLGLNNYGNKSVAKIRDDKDKLNTVFSEIYCMQLLTGFFIVLIFIICQTLNVFSNSKFMWLQFPFILSAIFDVNWFFFGIENFKLTVTRNIIIKVLIVIFTFVLVKNGNDTYKYILLLSSGMLLSNICLFPFLKKFIKFKIPKIKDILKHYKENIILFIPVVATSIYTVMDKIMLGYFTNMSNVGYYEYADRIKNLPLGLISALGTVMLPRMSNLYNDNKNIKKALKYIDISMNFILWLSVAMAFGIASISKEFIIIFLGNSFFETINIILVLSFSIVCIAWANVIRTQYLIPNSKNKIYVLSTILGAFINFISNMVLIRLYGVIGAAIGTLLSEFCVAFYQSISVKKELELKEYLMYFFKYLFIGLIMFMVNHIIFDNASFNILLTLILKLITGFIVYLILSLKFIKTNYDILGSIKKNI